MRKETLEEALKRGLEESETILWHASHRSPLPKAITGRLYLIGGAILCVEALLLLILPPYALLRIALYSLTGLSAAAILVILYLDYLRLKVLFALTDERGIILKRVILSGKMSWQSISYEEMSDYLAVCLGDVTFVGFDIQNPERKCGRRRSFLVPDADVETVRQIIDGRCQN